MQRQAALVESAYVVSVNGRVIGLSFGATSILHGKPSDCDISSAKLLFLFRQPDAASTRAFKYSGAIPQSQCEFVHEQEMLGTKLLISGDGPGVLTKLK
jgi:hypothetical protein